MQEYEQFKAVKDKGVQLQKKTYKAYSSFKAGLVLLLVGVGGFAFDILNMIDWIMYGCSPLNTILHIMAALILAGIAAGAFVLMRSGGKNFLYRTAELLTVYNDHICIQYIPYKKPKDRVQLNLYYCDIRSMKYLPAKCCVCIDSPAQIRSLTEKKGNQLKTIHEPEKGNYFIYDWYNNFGTMLDLIEEKSLQKITARPAH